MKDFFYRIISKIYSRIFSKTFYIGETPVLITKRYKKTLFGFSRTFLDRESQNQKIRVYLFKSNRHLDVYTYRESKTTEVIALNNLKDYFFDDVVYTVIYKKNQIISIQGCSTEMWQDQIANKTQGIIKPATIHYKEGRIYKEVFVTPVFYSKDAWNMEDVHYYGSYPTCIYYQADGTVDEDRSLFHLRDDKNPILTLFDKKEKTNPAVCLDCDLQGGCIDIRYHMHGHEINCYNLFFVSYKELKFFLSKCYIDLDNWRNFTLTERMIIHIVLNPDLYEDLLSLACISFENNQLNVSKEQLSLLEMMLVDTKISIRIRE